MITIVFSHKQAARACYQSNQVICYYWKTMHISWCLGKTASYNKQHCLMSMLSSSLTEILTINPQVANNHVQQQPRLAVEQKCSERLLATRQYTSFPKVGFILNEHPVDKQRPLTAGIAQVSCTPLMNFEHFI